MMGLARSPRQIAFALSMLVLLPGAAPPAAEPSASLTAITVFFKLDPRVSDPTHGGTQWISPPTYAGANAQNTVEARAQGVEANGRLSPIRAKWIASDPNMVKVSPSQGNEVRIVVKRAGQSSVKVVSGRVSQLLTVQSRYEGKFIQIAITQVREVKRPSPAPTDKASALQNTLAEKTNDTDVTLPSGLRYKILKRGSGQTPAEDDIVECRYRVSTGNGREVDTSHASEPLTFSVAEMRWKEVLKLMPVGSTWQILVPSHPVPAGDKPRGRGRAANPVRMSMPLIVEMELLSIKKQTGERISL
jgi:FKBP-type peptidyl-prolyl cis-trans isomerase